jgi:F-type H+-transporting ATPase subunit delta
MHNPRVARRYAIALMSVVREAKCVDTAADDMAQIERTLHASRDLEVMLASPIMSEGKKTAVLHEVFAKRVGQIPLAFMDLLVRKHRVINLREVATQFLALWDEQRGVITAEVTAAVELDAPHQQALKAELERRTGKTVKMLMKRNSAIMGGLVIRIGDTVLDSSVQHQLALLRERFIGSSRVAM